MIIVLVLDQFETGHDGVTVSGMRFAEYLRKNGHEVRIVSTGKLSV